MTPNSTDIYQSLLAQDYGLIFKAIMEHSKDGLFVTDHTGKVVMINRATEKMFEIESSQVLGRNVATLVEEGFWNPSVSLKVIETKRAVSLIQETRNKRKMLSTGIPIFDEKKCLKFVLVNDRDISFLNRMMTSLEADAKADPNIQFDLAELGMAGDALAGLVVRSQVMFKVMQTVTRAAKFDIPLVLTGASGVGKSMVARLVHELSQRHSGPFTDLNCAAIAPGLLESELFGYEPGAFTGASPKGKPGLFVGAHQGTLFLDEIGEMPLALQAKLLKFMDTQQFFRVGGTVPQTIDTRIIAATNGDLEKMVDQGKFRNDLYFRLNVVPIHIPSLKERQEEIEPLTQFFLKKFNSAFQTAKVITKSARQTLSQYTFPGNVRELENLIKRLVTMTEGDFIREKNLPAMLLDAISCDKGCTREEVQTYQEAVAAFERKMIQDAIQKHGSQRKAAKALGLNQSTLSRKLKP